MDISNLLNYINMATMGICLCVGYALKTAFSNFPNQYIPLTMLVSGTLINIYISQSIDETTILSGMISGLASTGAYEMLRNLINSSD